MNFSSHICACLFAGLISLQPAQAEFSYNDVQPLVEGLKGPCASARAWGHEICGPTLFVEANSRAYVAVDLVNGKLLGSGLWPEDRNVANTSVDWGGRIWAMVMWPASKGDFLDAQRLVLHENFHRIQSQLPFSAGAYRAASHLDSVTGRVSLRLELLMLEKAVTAESARVRRAYAHAAYLYRSERIGAGPALEAERHLNIHEGLPEYEAVRGIYRTETPDRLSSALMTAEKSQSFVRSFAYSLAPAWIYLLDMDAKEWRDDFDGSMDFADIYHARILAQEEGSLTTGRALRGQIEAEEKARAAHHERQRDTFVSRFVAGTTIQLPQGSFSFDPNTAVSLGEYGTVYRTFSMKGDWGSFETTRGALVSNDYSKVTIDYIEKDNGLLLDNVFWTLKLSQGWQIVPMEQHFQVVRQVVRKD